MAMRIVWFVAWPLWEVAHYFYSLECFGWVVANGKVGFFILYLQELQLNSLTGVILEIEKTNTDCGRFALTEDEETVCTLIFFLIGDVDKRVMVVLCTYRWWSLPFTLEMESSPQMAWCSSMKLVVVSMQSFLHSSFFITFSSLSIIFFLSDLALFPQSPSLLQLCTTLFNWQQ